MDNRSAFYIFLSVVTILRVIYSGWFELSLDEAYYWTWARNLQAGYYDHPPMVACMIALTGLIGESERWIRLAAVLCGSGVTWIIYHMASEIFGERRAGFQAAILFNLAPLFAIGSLVITPDAPLCLFWSLCLYFGWKITETQKSVYWAVLGVCFGLALLSKYNAALFAGSFFLFLLFSVENRHWLLRKEPYLAFLIAIVIFSPVIYWNQAHDWASFRFQLSHGFSDSSGNAIKNAVEFWIGQIGVFGVFMFFFFVAASYGMWRAGVKRRRDDLLYLFFMSAPLLLFFLVNSFRSRMEGNWSITAYLAAIIATPGFVKMMAEEMEDKKRRRFMAGYAFSIVFSALLLLYAHIQIVDPVLPMPNRYEVSRRIYGWKILAGESAGRLGKLGPGAFIIANRYQVSTLLTYYTPGHRPAYITNGKGRFGYLGSVAHLPGKNALYVTEAGRADIDLLSTHFDLVEPAGTIRIERNGELIRKFEFYKCYNYQGGLIET